MTNTRRGADVFLRSPMRESTPRAAGQVRVQFSSSFPPCPLLLQPLHSTALRTGYVLLLRKQLTFYLSNEREIWRACVRSFVRPFHHFECHTKQGIPPHPPSPNGLSVLHKGAFLTSIPSQLALKVDHGEPLRRGQRPSSFYLLKRWISQRGRM